MSNFLYSLLSDLHCHNWSAYSSVDADGVNSRLRHILNEVERAAAETVKAGGKFMLIAGDVFHVRGQIAPEVMNSTIKTFDRVAKMGIRVFVIPGNHDLSSKDTQELTNAAQALNMIDGVEVITKPTLVYLNGKEKVVMIPWEPDNKELTSKILEFMDKPNVNDHLDWDLVLHAGIDDVFPNMPAHGLTAKQLAKWDYRRVFAGHYHNHKVMEEGKVISIGASTHQTFSDIGSKAGFLMVYDDKVEYRASHAPQFVEINEKTEEDDIPLIVNGNFVRVRDIPMNDVEIKNFRDELVKMGAKGVSIEVPRKVTTARTGTPRTKRLTLNNSINAFIDEKGYPEEAKLKAYCSKILADVQTAS